MALFDERDEPATRSATVYVLGQKDCVSITNDSASNLTGWGLKTQIFRSFNCEEWIIPANQTLYKLEQSELEELIRRTQAQKHKTSSGYHRQFDYERISDDTVIPPDKSCFACDVTRPLDPSTPTVSAPLPSSPKPKKRISDGHILRKKKFLSTMSKKQATPSAHNSFAFGHGLMQGIANYEASFRIFAVADDRQMLDTASYLYSGDSNSRIAIDIVSVKVAKGALVVKEGKLPYTVTPLSDSVTGVNVSFIPKESGAYLVSIKVGNQQLSDSPYRLTVTREEDINPTGMLNSKRYVQLAQVIVRFCVRPNLHHHFFSSIGVESLKPLLEQAEATPYILYALNALLINEENRVRLAIEGGTELINAIGSAPGAWECGQYYYLLLFLCNVLEGLSMKGNLGQLRKFAPINKLAELLSQAKHPLCRLAAARSVLSLSKQAPFCAVLAKSQFRIAFLEEAVLLVVGKTGTRDGEDLGPWDPDIISARLNCLQSLSNMIDANVIQLEDTPLILKILQKLSSLFMHSQMRKAAFRFANRCVLMCLSRENPHVLIISKHIRKTYTSLLAILKSTMYTMSITHETRMAGVFANLESGKDSIPAESDKTPLRRDRDRDEEQFELLILISTILAKELNDLLPPTVESSGQSQVSPSAPLSATQSFTKPDENKFVRSTTGTYYSNPFSDGSLSSSETHSAQGEDSMSQLLVRKVHVSSLLAVSRFMQCVHTQTQIQACRIFQILSSYSNSRDAVAEYGFYPLSQILGSEGDATVADRIAVNALNNFMQPLGKKPDDDLGVSLSPWEIREDKDLYKYRGEPHISETAQRMIVTKHTVHKLLSMISSHDGSQEGNLDKVQLFAHQQAIVMLGRLLKNEASRAVVVEKGKEKGGAVRRILRFGIEHKLLSHPKLEKSQLKIGQALPKQKALDLHPSDLLVSKEKRCMVAKWKGKRVAVKMIDSNILQSTDIFLLETSLVSLLDHPRIVQMLALSTNGQSYYSAWKFYSHGSLLNIIYNPTFTLQPVFIFQAAEDICSGLAYLHSFDTTHLSIKPQNLLVDDGWRVSISDIGSNRMYRTRKSLFEWNKSSMRYTAPEIYQGGWQKGVAPSDVWSFGLVIYELICRKKPFQDVPLEEYEMRKAIYEGWSRLETDEVPSELEPIIAQCLTLDRSRRPSFRELLGTFKQLKDGGTSKQKQTYRPSRSERKSTHDSKKLQRATRKMKHHNSVIVNSSLAPPGLPTPPPSPPSPSAPSLPAELTAPIVGPVVRSTSGSLTRHENQNLRAFGWNGLNAAQGPNKDTLQEMLHNRERKMSMKTSQKLPAQNQEKNVTMADSAIILPDSVPQTETALGSWSSSDGEWSSDDGVDNSDTIEKIKEECGGSSSDEWSVGSDDERSFIKSKVLDMDSDLVILESEEQFPEFRGQEGPSDEDLEEVEVPLDSQAEGTNLHPWEVSELGLRNSPSTPEKRQRKSLSFENLEEEIESPSGPTETEQPARTFPSLASPLARCRSTELRKLPPKLRMSSELSPKSGWKGQWGSEEWEVIQFDDNTQDFFDEVLPTIEQESFASPEKPSRDEVEQRPPQEEAKIDERKERVFRRTRSSVVNPPPPESIDLGSAAQIFNVLISDRTSDEARQAVLLLYPSVVKPKELLGCFAALLAKRTHSSERSVTCSVLCLWISLFFKDDFSATTSELVNKIMKNLDPGHPKEKSIIDQIRAKHVTGKANREKMKKNLLKFEGVEATSSSQNPPHFLSLETKTLANHLSYWHYLLCQIVSPRDFIAQTASQSLIRVIKHAQDLEFWVAATILLEKSQKNRAEIISKFIRLAASLLDQQNFGTSKSIMNGLAQPCIDRLKGSFDLLSKDLLSQRELLNQFVGPSGQVTYSKAILKLVLSQSPFIPCMDFFLEAVRTQGHSVLSQLASSKRMFVMRACKLFNMIQNEFLRSFVLLCSESDSHFVFPVEQEHLLFLTHISSCRQVLTTGDLMELSKGLEP